VDLQRGLQDTLIVLGAKARTKSVSATIELEPNLPPVRALAGELNQVWANLIDNALDALPEGGQLRVSVKRHARFVVVRVIDDGPGIPEDIRKRIFDPFFTTKEPGKGTGLGLEISRRIVRAHRGDIEFDSRPGCTEFRVFLPIAEESSTTAPAHTGA
jgi:signal transduction histidine kinase